MPPAAANRSPPPRYDSPNYLLTTALQQIFDEARARADGKVLPELLHMIETAYDADAALIPHFGLGSHRQSAFNLLDPFGCVVGGPQVGDSLPLYTARPSANERTLNVTPSGEPPSYWEVVTPSVAPNQPPVLAGSKRMRETRANAGHRQNKRVCTGEGSAEHNEKDDDITSLVVLMEQLSIEDPTFEDPSAQDMDICQEYKVRS
ncbi:hypothetical protein B0T20DRAFT_478714 [Sordaria brevicollis]|uniref:Uncharacterized protein n=1 Tax=Sordaria brevicollis TaxID=83679 RepID=A0AAE0UCS4_SORBR|nr:hypothetical protein B0T20DRAFT_478714 [Sordaria brevicollis]